MIRDFTELDLDGYKQNVSKTVDEVVKQFDPAFVITVDGRRPVRELLETVKARLTMMPVQYPVVPERVSLDPRLDGMSISSGNRAYSSEWSNEFGEELQKGWTAQRTAYEGTGELGEELDFEGESDRGVVAGELREQTRSMSEFGRLCPVNFLKDSYKLGSHQYRVKFMGIENLEIEISKK